ncbi:response regulator transcription factor [Pseudonocardia oroxyli]|jgi:DNA-binding NarL/FixJ family response regulator|uniref:Response regulator receiver domain-containing protein n=1 Tax=Pseudonocardia oroxyli TaxID=366584 RepID=A0A1G7VL81_PSEOR|nr:response regulator transcription factor [Pseudonocardia oroxyli]SDG60427.1 Response regulator receiver domain-containing protein [Pseudonocardia oroxyli]
MERQGASATGPGPVRVLVVDDQRPFRTAAAAVIARMPGWEVAGVAETGEDAVAVAEGLRPDLVLMDYNLPGIDGAQAAARVREVAPQAATVLCSTYRAEDLRIDPATIAGYLHKEELGAPVLRALWARIHPAA